MAQSARQAQRVPLDPKGLPAHLERKVPSARKAQRVTLVQLALQGLSAQWAHKELKETPALLVLWGPPALLVHKGPKAILAQQALQELRVRLVLWGQPV